jgi:hypothetical protein
MFSIFGDDCEPSSGATMTSDAQELSLSAFSIQTPTIGPMATDEKRLKDASSDAHSRFDSEMKEYQVRRSSPRLTPLFPSPVFTLNTPVIGCAQSPATFSIADAAG